MIFKRFFLGLLWRIVLITMLSMALAWCIIRLVANPDAVYWLSSLLLFGLIIYRGVDLFYYSNATNRKLTRFFDSIQYDDFSIKFSSDNTFGKSFQGLNKQFNKVLEAFRKIRAENEASLHLVNTIIQNVETGLLLYDQYGRIELSNSAACKLLGFYRIKNIAELKSNHPELAEKLLSADDKHFLFQGTNGIQLSVNIVAIRSGGQIKNLVSLQNIQPEMQQKEVEAWQNLTRVLRHEIMNSLTPILSLIGTMKHIVDKELPATANDNGAKGDLQEALQTLESRGIGMINFVDGYRSFTSIPSPSFSEVNMVPFVSQMMNLLQPEMIAANISFMMQNKAGDQLIEADAEQLSMVLINLIKNAKEALEHTINPSINIQVSARNQWLLIEVTDNGPGIEPEAMEDIFIPFFTTKENGSGIGLSLSRQIIQQHGGAIKVYSEVGKGSRFVVQLKIKVIAKSAVAVHAL
jgi:two-component system, NtrC family, nitrogen regulation sensor histidine kinase NtrY